MSFVIDARSETTAGFNEQVGRRLGSDLSTQPGRADLIHALVHRGEAGLGELAGLLGYADRERPPENVVGKGEKQAPPR